MLFTMFAIVCMTGVWGKDQEFLGRWKPRGRCLVGITHRSLELRGLGYLGPPHRNGESGIIMPLAQVRSEVCRKKP